MYRARGAPLGRFAIVAVLLLLTALSYGSAAADEAAGQTSRGQGRIVGRFFQRLRQAINPLQNDRPADLERETVRQNRLVLRLSEDFFDGVVDRDVDRLTPVAEVILGTPVSGQARTVGRPTVNLLPDDSQAVFEVVLTGTTVSRTTGRNRSAIIYSHATTDFQATKQVVFDPQRGFRAQPATVDARTQLVTDGIGSTSRSRLVDRMVRRRAWQEVQRNRPQAQAIAQAKAKARIQEFFDQRLEEGLARLNRATYLRSVLATLVPGESRLAFVCCSTEDSVQIAISPRDQIGVSGALPVPLPEAPLAAGPMQLWVHSSLLGALFQRAPDRFPWAGPWLAQWSANSRAATSAALVNRLAVILIGDEVPLEVVSAGEWMVVPLSGASQTQRMVRRPTWR